MRRFLALTLCALLVSGCRPKKEGAFPYLHTVRGDAPVIIIAPHAGWERPVRPSAGLGEIAPERDRLSERRPCDSPEAPKDCRGGPCVLGGLAGGSAVGGADQFTYPLALTLAMELEGCLGAKPYVVVPTIARSIIDFNRDAKDPTGGSACAFYDPDAEFYWRQYHDQVESYVDEIKSRFSGRYALLLDVHGCGCGSDNDPHTLVLGSGSPVGLTMPDQRARDEKLGFLFDPHPLSGFGAAFLDQLDRAGFTGNRIVPATIDSPYLGMPNGGYSVRRYSRLYGNWGGPQHEPTRPRIDSLQLEFSSLLRVRPEVAAKVTAQSLCSALKAHPGSL